MTYKSTIVLVGTNNFETRLFDGSRILPEVCPDFSIAPESSMGKMVYRFDNNVVSISPNRISIEQIESQILPESLEGIVHNVVSILDVPNTQGVTAIGFNLNTVVMQKGSQVTGTEFCASMMNVDGLSTLVGGAIQFGCIKSVFFMDGLNCTLQLEPEFSTHGANLVMAVNIRQDIGSRDSLVARFHQSMERIRPYVADLSMRVRDLFLGQIQ